MLVATAAATIITAIDLIAVAPCKQIHADLSDPPDLPDPPDVPDPSDLPRPTRPPYLDQSGFSLFPALVSWRTSLPSRAIVNTCVLPDRVDVKTMWRPLGANAGLSLLPSLNVSCRVTLVARSSTLTSKPGPVRDE